MEGYIPSEEYLAKTEGEPKILDFALERNTIAAGFGDDLSKLLQLSTIYFDYNKYNIRKDSEIEVEKVIAAMEKYPSLKIKVNAYTDTGARTSITFSCPKNVPRPRSSTWSKKGLPKIG